jgi:MarR family transcriptional regulator, organic hydroperoxide resistance regulator
MQRLPRQPHEPARPLGLLIAGARRSIKQAATRRLGRRRLSAQQFWLLVALHEQPCPSLRELAERRLMDSPTASRMVEVLVRRGLVRIEGCPEDRRRRSIALTAPGAALARELRPLALELREAIQGGFSEAEAERFRRMLLRVIANVERLEKNGSAATARRAAAGGTK